MCSRSVPVSHNPRNPIKPHQTHLDIILHRFLPVFRPLPTPAPHSNFLHQGHRLPTQTPLPVPFILIRTPNQKLPLLIQHRSPLPPPLPRITRRRGHPRSLPPLSHLGLPLAPPHAVQHLLPLLPRRPQLLRLPPQSGLHHPRGLALHAPRGGVERGLVAAALVGAQPGEGGADEGEGFSLALS